MSPDPSVKGIVRANDSSITICKGFYHLAQDSLVLFSPLCNISEVFHGGHWLRAEQHYLQPKDMLSHPRCKVYLAPS